MAIAPGAVLIWVAAVALPLFVCRFAKTMEEATGFARFHYLRRSQSPARDPS